MMSEKKINWTEQQQRAIGARGGNVLVTASAGTGKTAVLSQRFVSLVSDESLCPHVMNVLVLTFTEAAAEQMRSRIARQLREAFCRGRDPRLGRQLTLLQGADISTIHSFCKRLITEGFHVLSLDPAFRVIDGDEAMLLKAEVLGDTIEWAWQQHDLAEELPVLLHRRDLRENHGFLANVVRLNDFLEGVVLPDAWCDRACHLAEAVDPPVSDLGHAQKHIVEDRLNTALAQLHQAKALYESEAPDGTWGGALEEQLIKPISACLDRLRADDWQGCARMIRDFDKPKAPPLRGLPKTTGQLVKDLRSWGAKAFAGLRDLAVVNPEYLDIVGRSSGRQTRILIELVRKFTHLYAERKRALNGLDFADLERYALRLLTTEDSSGPPLKPSETALALRRRYKYIFVDEYQDINPVQQAILDALGSGDNVFVVGDVKQSIYAWRGAEPTIFLERLAPASVDPKDLSRGFRVDLNYNFRSPKAILDFVNKVFGRIMTSAVAHIDYDDAARLRPSPQAEAGAPPSGRKRHLVELHVLDERAESEDAQRESDNETEGDGEIDLVYPRQRQAAMIGQRIREMVGAETGRPEFQIYDSETESRRDVEYRDIVVLMRSLARKANDYVEIFRLAGIPVNCDATAGYFEATEISDVLCLLKVLDNPQRDIEFAAVLRSPFFGVNDSELAKIRHHGRDESKTADFYTCAVRCRDLAPDAELRRKLSGVFETLEQWRTLARRGKLADLLWTVYRETRFIAFVSALPNGQAREANLLKLHDRAVQFEGFASSAGIPSLTRFVAFIEKLQEAGQDWAPAQPGSAAGNAVRILSVHKSKGLEFPVVFLAELESAFNKRDVQADLVADTKDTVGLQIIDRASNTKLRSLAHQVIGEKKLAAGLAEEMRILYVATTRARDRLILTASQKRTDCGKLLARGLLLSGDTIPDWLLRAGKNALEWVLCGLADQRVLHEAFETGLSADAFNDDLFEFTLHGWDDLRAFSQLVLSLRGRKAGSAAAARGKSPSAAEGKQALAALKERLDRRYPFVREVHLPAKSSVTELTHQTDEFARLDFSRALDRLPMALTTSGPEIPQPPAPRLIGTAAHLVIAELDLKHPVTGEAIEKTKDRLVNEGALTASVAQGVDSEAILAFFESALGTVVLDANSRVCREWPFTFARPTSELNGYAGPAEPAAKELIVVQGIVDLLVRTPEGLLVIDFKTDRIAEGDLHERAETYRGQLELYAEAASRILDRKVLEKWLYFLTLRQAVSL